jgi:hypothetical protein
MHHLSQCYRLYRDVNTTYTTRQLLFHTHLLLWPVGPFQLLIAINVSLGTSHIYKKNEERIC